MAIKTSLLAIVFTTSLLAAQPGASFTTYGTACTSPNGRAASIGAQNLPRLGQSFTITYAGPNVLANSSQQRVQPIFVVGFGQRTVTIPVGLLPRQPAGCTLLTTVDATVPMAPDPNGTGFTSEITLAIPQDTRLLGGVVYAQWLAVFEQCGFAGCSPEWIITSPGGIATIGL